MIWLFGILTAASWLLLLVYFLKTRRMLRDLGQSLDEERRFLLEDPSTSLHKLGFPQVVKKINQLMDRCEVVEKEGGGFSNQIEAVLGSIQEAVLIFDNARTIEYANESARRLFQVGLTLKGAKLESALRSPSLLEFLGNPATAHSTKPHQVSLDWRGETLWFEASRARVEGVGQSGRGSTILVLHDITRLKSLEMVRRDFVANVSHELRTPLTIIKGFAETLNEDNDSLPADSRARFIGKIVNNVQRLHVLVEDLLTLSRLESGPDQMDMAQYSLKELLRDTIDNYGNRIDPAEQSLVFEYDNRVGEFLFDRYRIHQVVDNLVENAFRYAPEFTRLVLKVQLDDNGFVICSLADDGPGIAPKDLPHVFERFYRADKGRSRERGGTGLGLSITKHIVQLHGGSVWVESILGEGASFFFSLPYAVVGEDTASLHTSEAIE
jgi:signal transduction histidine kinase